MVSTGALSMRARDEFAKKCVARRRPRETPVEDLDARSCYGDEHYFATVLALHGEDYATTCSEGVTYVNWEAYASGHPKTFASVGAFAREREKRPRVELLSCGGRAWTPRRRRRGSGSVCLRASSPTTPVATSRASGGTPSGRDARLHEKRSRYSRLNVL